jgi:hypothetical protein
MGGLITNSLIHAGWQDTYAGILGGGAGGALAGGISNFLKGRLLDGAKTGGAIGLAGGAASAAIAGLLRAGNDCGCSDQK